MISEASRNKLQKETENFKMEAANCRRKQQTPKGISKLNRETASCKRKQQTLQGEKLMYGYISSVANCCRYIATNIHN